MLYEVSPKIESYYMQLCIYYESQLDCSALLQCFQHSEQLNVQCYYWPAYTYCRGPD